MWLKIDSSLRTHEKVWDLADELNTALLLINLIGLHVPQNIPGVHKSSLEP